MTDEIKQLIEDAARLLGFEILSWYGSTPTAIDAQGILHGFNPCDRERGDLMKVAEAAELVLNMRDGIATGIISIDRFGRPYLDHDMHTFTKGDHDSKVLAILRAASAVLKENGG